MLNKFINTVFEELWVFEETRIFLSLKNIYVYNTVLYYDTFTLGLSLSFYEVSDVDLCFDGQALKKCKEPPNL